MYEAVFRVHDGRFAVVLRFLLNERGGLVSCLECALAVGHRSYHCLNLLVSLQQLDGEIAGGVAQTYIIVGLQELLYFRNSALDVGAVVDMQVSEHVVLRAVAAGKVFVVFLRAIVLMVFVVPVSDVLRHLGVEVSLLVNIVDALIHIYNNMEEQVDASSCGEHRGYHGNTEQASEFLMVELVASSFRLVVHVQGANHAQMHVDELSGEIEVPFQVAGINDVDDDVGRFLNDLFSHIKLFWRIGRKAVCARQVDNVEPIALELGITLLGVDGDTRIVAHSFVGTAGEIE